MATYYNTLFARLGRLFKHAEAVRDYQGTLDTQYTSTVGQFSGLQTEQIGVLSRNLEGRKSQATSTCQDLLASATRTLVQITDDEFKLTEATTEGALQELIRQMIADSKSVDGTTTAVGSVTAASGNVGNGTFLASTVAPILDKYGNRHGNATLQNAKAETLTADCTGDSTSRTIDVQNERFHVYGQRSEGQFHEDWPAGSGRQVQITAVSSAQHGGRGPTRNVTHNGNFEQITSNAPSNWVVESGVVGNHVLAAGAGYNGSNALKLVGDGSTTIRLYQRLRRTDETMGQITPDRPYTISFAVKYATAAPTASIRVAVEDASGNRLNASLVGREMSATIASGSVTTSYQLVTATCFSPLNIPKGSRIVVETTANLANTSEIFIDDVAVAEMQRLGPGSPAVQLIPGSTAFRVGDKFTRPITNDGAGIVVREFDRFFSMESRGLMLPSKTDGSETQADTVYA